MRNLSDNFNLLPGEAFTALADVANNLIDKISNATGYLFMPHGKRKDKEEAIKYLIDNIKDNKDMPTYLKAVAISNSRILLKQYGNQQDVVSEAITYLKDTATPEKMDDDWLMYFLDKAGSISNRDVRIIYSNILAAEANSPGTASKALVNTISIMDKELADSFRKMIKCMVYIKDEDDEETPSIIYPLNDEEVYNKSLMFSEIINLCGIGLIELQVIRGYVWNCKEINARYGEEEFLLRASGEANEIPIGNISLTKTGIELATILTPEKEDGYFDKIKNYWSNNGIEVVEK